MKKMISITVPCYNEQDNVRQMSEILTQIMEQLNYPYEIVFTDNGSTDSTQQILRELAAENHNIKVLMNNRNYGMDGRSARNAAKYLSGDIIIHIPCDFQEPPELIPEFIDWWEKGYKVVLGQKVGSKESKIKYLCRCFFYKIIKSFSDVPQYENVSGIALMDREVYEKFLKTDEDIILRHAVADMGYDVKLIQYVQQKRKSGKSSYNIWRYLSFAISSMVNTSTTPLRMMTVFGVCLSFVSFLIGTLYVIMKLILWDRFQAGVAPVLVGMLFLGSIQLLFMGVIGEYIGVVLRKITKRPEVILKEKLNFKDEIGLSDQEDRN